MVNKKSSNEAFYDENISPLMTRIIALCTERDIPHVCVFQLEDKDANDGVPMLCSTLRVHPKNTAPELIAAYKAINRKPEIFTVTIVTKPK